jgi:hypothetical protein
MSPIAHQTVGSELGEILLDRMKLELSASLSEHERDLFRNRLEELLGGRAGPLGTWLDQVLAADSSRGQEGDQVRELTSWLRNRNQFVVLDDLETARAERLFRELFAEIRDLVGMAPLERRARVRSLEDKIGAFVRSLPPGAALEVPSGSYSAELQLEVLGLDARRLTEPVLDLGCGNPPRLLLFLKREGIDAVGLDRDGGEGVLTADWLEHDFAADSWGSILSHLAFSLHFLHHHLAPGATAAAYAKKYMELLRSLRPSGTFAYVPGLPFIERLLPKNEYRLSRHPLDQALASGLAPFTLALGEPVSYASRVERLASTG